MSEIKIHASSVEMRDIKSIKPYGRNNRKHPPEQVAALAKMISDGGWTQPIVIDDRGIVIAGHGRLLAAQSLDLARVPCVVAKGLSEAQKKAMRISDNRSGSMFGADWDFDNLKLEIGDLKLDGFDLDLTGFGAGDLDDLFAESLNQDQIDIYTHKIEAPIYKPTGEKPNVSDLFDAKKNGVSQKGNIIGKNTKRHKAILTNCRRAPHRFRF